MKPWARVGCFLSESGHSSEGCLAIAGFVLVLDKLNLVLVRWLVFGFGFCLFVVVFLIEPARIEILHAQLGNAADIILV